MSREHIVEIIDLAIEAGVKGSAELSDVFMVLDENLETGGKEGVLRYFFDCWSDALNHDFMVYKTKNPVEWKCAAQELKSWYMNEVTQLSEREIWNEALPKNA